MNKAKELREMSDEQLAVLLKDTTESLFRLRLQAQTERLDAPSELRKHRRLVARIHTIRHQRELAAAGSAQGESAQRKSHA
ncbi:MAG: 50S ribosomal protein L29 [Planctomycetota bacterium]